LGVWNFFAQLNLVEGTFTGVSPASEGQTAFLGQMHCPVGASVARLSFIMPGDGADSSAVSELMDYLTDRAGEWGALYLVAEVDERSPALEVLRRACFTVYTRQSIWHFTDAAVFKAETENHPQSTEGFPQSTEGFPQRAGGFHKRAWQMAGSVVNSIAVRNLFQSIVPPMVQPLEAQHNARFNGLTYHENGELLAYAELTYGPRGIWVQPFIHPATENVPDLLLALMRELPRRAGRQVYLGVRAYQAWLEPLLESLDATAGPRQALMVRRLAAAQKVTARVHLPALEKQQAEPSAPFARIEPHVDNKN
jgi:hypothetical protein